jgi:AraC-like DNA-binding protein
MDKPLTARLLEAANVLWNGASWGLSGFLVEIAAGDSVVSDQVTNGGSRIPSTTGGPARLAYAKAKASGIEVEPLLSESTLTLDQIEDRKARMEVVDQIVFLNLVADAVKDDFLGFHLAEHVDLRKIGLLYYVLASSDTITEALRRAVRYSSIVNEGIVLNCVEKNCIGISLSYSGVSRHSDRHQIEFWMTILLRICRKLTGLRLSPRLVSFAHHREQRPAAFDTFFGDLEFGADIDEITFEERVRQLPVVSADSYLNDLLITYCEEALQNRPTISGPFRSSVENEITQLLPHGTVRVGAIAQRLGMSQRTLARRLESEGLNFSEVLENLRCDLANRYLADDDLSISQIAWLLGYKEVGALSHAFKRWTGRTPSEVRPRLAS